MVYLIKFNGDIVSSFDSYEPILVNDTIRLPLIDGLLTVKSKIFTPYQYSNGCFCELTVAYEETYD